MTGSIIILRDLRCASAAIQDFLPGNINFLTFQTDGFFACDGGFHDELGGGFLFGRSKGSLLTNFNNKFLACHTLMRLFACVLLRAYGVREEVSFFPNARTDEVKCQGVTSLCDQLAKSSS